jgi:hypothetical protein
MLNLVPALIQARGFLLHQKDEPMTARKTKPLPPTPPPAPARGETFRVLARLWDVDAMNAELDAHPERVRTVETQTHKGGLYGFVTIDEDLLDSLENPDRPIIMLGIQTQKGVGYIVADGNHRLERALRAGQDTIQIFLIPADDEPNFRLN